MKMICEVPDEVIKLIKGGMWCGSHIATKIITNGIPLSSSEKPNKPECEHDHEILKAYSDGASAVMDKIRAEIDGLLNDEDNSMYAHGVMDCLEIIDKFMAEGSEE